MKIVKPSAEIIEQHNKISHIAKCMRICYLSESGNDKKLYDSIFIKKHFSMLRHYSMYISIPYNANTMLLLERYFLYSPYCHCNNVNGIIHITTNYQYYFDLFLNNKYINKDDTINLKILNDVYSNYLIHEKTKYHIPRITIKLITQISTTRELNRVSINSIAEQSTRYCNFSKDKFNNEITICMPVWMEEELKTKCNCDNLTIENDSKILINKYTDRIENAYYNWCNCEISYFRQLKYGATPQEAREQLPLATKTEVMYTYTLEEWKHIFDLRYFGTTGTPHPNTKKAVSLIIDEFIKNNYLHKNYKDGE